jgi:hypothetical protein
VGAAEARWGVRVPVRREARATLPTPTPQSRKKWRRVISRRGLGVMGRSLKGEHPTFNFQHSTSNESQSNAALSSW